MPYHSKAFISICSNIGTAKNILQLTEVPPIRTEKFGGCLRAAIRTIPTVLPEA